MLILLLTFGCNKAVAENTISKNVNDLRLTELCQSLKTLDSRISKTLIELPKYEGEYLVKDMADYNNALTRLVEYLADHRTAILSSEEAVELLKEGAPDYFEVNIDPDKAKLNFGWLHKGLDEIFQLRSSAIKIWSALNRMSRLIPLEYYYYPQNTTYTGYENPGFPPLKERMDVTVSSKAVRRISELCDVIRTSDQAVYNALEMKHKPSRDKEMLRKHLGDYNEALLALRRMAVDNKDQVLRLAKDIFDEGLPKYFRVSFAEYKLEDKLDMASGEIDNIYVQRGKAMEIWSDIHSELGTPW